MCRNVRRHDARCALKEHRLTVIRVVLTILCAAAVGFIFYNSMKDAGDSASRSHGLREALNSVLRWLGIGWELSEYFVRKAAHFVEFFVLGGLLSATLRAYVPRIRVMLLALPLSVAVAVCDELIQTGSPGRSCQLSDVLLDSSAALTAVMIAVLILYLRTRRKSKDISKTEVNRDE